MNKLFAGLCVFAFLAPATLWGQEPVWFSRVFNFYSRFDSKVLVTGKDGDVFWCSAMRKSSGVLAPYDFIVETDTVTVILETDSAEVYAIAVLHYDRDGSLKDWSVARGLPDDGSIHFFGAAPAADSQSFIIAGTCHRNVAWGQDTLTYRLEGSPFDVAYQDGMWKNLKIWNPYGLVWLVAGQEGYYLAATHFQYSVFSYTYSYFANGGVPLTLVRADEQHTLA
ncbi:MAG: hypothetical protein OHK0039_18380 [Bacteroidia bacterium]